nr:PREDICTED: magnesium transporter MRS2 homolog, mitochondrial [Latimeria chalumnae]|eukprot:XP_006011917.2 PREDICTED: magnesium transporter MRS2 homolog, mitochondrial [Latimeria chalumnae]
MKFDRDGSVSSFERKKTELYQELGLQARDLRFQHLMSITSRNNRIIMRVEFLKAVITPEYLLILDYRHLNLERWLFRELAPQLAGDGQLVTYSLPFEFRAIEAILQHRITTLQSRLNVLQPLILETLEALVDPKLLSIDRSKLHILLQNSKNLSELETDVKVFKEAMLEILDEEELIEELCLTKWSGSQQKQVSLNVNDEFFFFFFFFPHSHRNVMMRLNLQLTMGTFSLSLFGLLGVAFGMNLESSFEEDPRAFWLVMGIMFLGSGLIWRRLLSFLGRHLEPTSPVHYVLKRTQTGGGRTEMKHNLKTETFGSGGHTLSHR